MKTTMKRYMVILGVALACALVSAAPSARAANTPKIIKMAGTISAIDLNYNTVVVNVPITEKKIFKVGGPLAGDAILKKNGRTNVTLKDFKVGDKVVVEWVPTPQGHLIKMLEAR